MSLDEEAIEHIRLLLRDRAYTLTDLIDGIGLSRRTIFRYLAVLKGRGHNVVRVGITRPTKYKIDD